MEGNRIETMRLRQFRNYEDELVTFAPGVNVIAGDNAQGKTNLLEAVFYFGSGKSNRAARDRELVRFGQESGSLEAKIVSGGRAQTLEARLFLTARRALFANGVKLASPRELVGKLPSVFFGPEELGLIRAGASARRRFMDLALCQLRPRYLMLLSEYTRLHGHKTRLLRDTRPGSREASTLPDFNRRLAVTGAALMTYRAVFVHKVSKAAAVIHGEVSGGRETLALSYAPHPDFNPLLGEEERAEELYAALCAQAPAEWASARALVGPHRDDITATLDGVSVRSFGSQGQTRTAALSMKLAERLVFKEEFGAYPVLLLDDVLSELDPHRQDFILHRIEDGQVIITCCEPERMTRLQNGKHIHIMRGKVV